MDYVVMIKSTDMSAPLVAIVDEPSPAEIMDYIEKSWQLHVASRVLCQWMPYEGTKFFPMAFAYREREAEEIYPGVFKLAPVHSVEFKRHCIDIYTLEDWIKANRTKRNYEILEVTHEQSN